MTADPTADPAEPTADPTLRSGTGPTRTDGVVRIRPIRPDEVDAHLAGEDDEIRRWFRFSRPSTPDDVAAFVARSDASFAARGPRRTFGIVDEASATLCGHVEANHLGDGVANLSYSVHAPWRGRGLASRAVRLCMADAVDALPIDRFVIRVDPGNEPSARVARACGFRIIGTHREGGHDHDEYLFDVLGRPAPAAHPARPVSSG